MATVIRQTPCLLLQALAKIIHWLYNLTKWQTTFFYICWITDQIHFAMHPIFKRIENAKSPDFGDIFSKSFELFKEVWTDGMVHVLVTMVVVIPFFIAVYVPLFPIYMDLLMNGGGPYYGEYITEHNGLWWFGYMLLVFFLAFALQVVHFAIYSHFLRRCKQVDLKSSEPIGGFFDDVKGNFGKLFVLTLMTFGIAMLAALLCYLPIFYVLVPLNLLLPIYAFNPEMSAGDIVKAGFKLGNRFWLVAFGLILIGSIIASFGAILCGIGIIATQFFAQIVLYYFYKDTVGFEDDLPGIESF